MGDDPSPAHLAITCTAASPEELGEGRARLRTIMDIYDATFTRPPDASESQSVRVVLPLSYLDAWDRIQHALESADLLHITNAHVYHPALRGTTPIWPPASFP